jgi:hypothetical protein
LLYIQDPHFSKDLLQKILKGDNPPAKLETSISINSVYSPESAYKAGFGHFWSESKPRKGDYFRIKFESPQVVSRIIIASGMEAHPRDMFYDAILETSSTLNKANNCTDYELKGKFVLSQKENVNFLN